MSDSKHSNAANFSNRVRLALKILFVPGCRWVKPGQTGIYITTINAARHAWRQSMLLWKEISKGPRKPLPIPTTQAGLDQGIIIFQFCKKGDESTPNFVPNKTKTKFWPIHLFPSTEPIVNKSLTKSLIIQLLLKLTSKDLFRNQGATTVGSSGSGTRTLKVLSETTPNSISIFFKL